MEINAKTLKKEVIEGLKSGKTKKELYNTLTEHTTSAREVQKVADIIRYIPHPEKLKKWGYINTLFLILLIVISLGIIAFDITNRAYSSVRTITFTPYLWFGLLIYLTIRKKFKHYYWISILGGIKFFMGIGFGVYNVFEEGLMPPYIIAALMVIGSIFILFGIMYPGRVCRDEKRDKTKQATL